MRGVWTRRNSQRLSRHRCADRNDRRTVSASGCDHLSRASDVFKFTKLVIHLTQVTTPICSLPARARIPAKSGRIRGPVRDRRRVSPVSAAAALARGLRCPRCGNAKAWPVRRVWLQRAACGRQTSVTAGTFFQDNRTPLTLRFRALRSVTGSKAGTSAATLQRVLGFGSYQTAWTWLHKLRRAMVRSGRDRLTGRVEVDEKFVGALEAAAKNRHVGGSARIDTQTPRLAMPLLQAIGAWARLGTQTRFTCERRPLRSRRCTCRVAWSGLRPRRPAPSMFVRSAACGPRPACPSPKRWWPAGLSPKVNS